MLPLQCITAEEKDTCLFYAYPEQWDSTSTMYADIYTQCRGGVMQIVYKIDTLRLSRPK